MARLKGSNSANLAQVEANDALWVQNVHPYVDDLNGGRYGVALKTGLVTALTAMTITAGHIGSFRNPSTTKTILVDRLAIKVAVVTDFTTVQQLQFAARKATGLTVLHTAGGAAVTLTGEGPKKRTSMLASIATAYLATTAVVTGQTAVDISSKTPLVMAAGSSPSSALTNTRQHFEDIYVGSERGGPIVLVQDEGFIFTSETLMGAAGTAVVEIDIDWREVLNANAADL